MPDNNKNVGLDQLDFRLVLAFTNAYEKMYDMGKIDEEQFEKVLLLIENFQNYTYDEFKEKLDDVFPEV